MADVLDPDTAEESGRRRPRRLLWVALAVVVGVVAFVFYWFQPHKLFIDETVNEAVPTVPTSGAPGDENGEPADSNDPIATEDPSTTTAAPEPAEPSVLATGEFISRDHGTSGTVQVLELVDGSRYVRLEALDTDNGPDLYVYLSTNPADGDEGAFDDDYVDLGRLSGNKGDQNYEVPAEVDLSQYSSVVIWCDRFDSAFGAADLTVVSAPS